MLDSQALRSMQSIGFVIEYRKIEKSSQHSGVSDILVDTYHFWFVSLRSFSEKRNLAAASYIQEVNVSLARQIE